VSAADNFNVDAMLKLIRSYDDKVELIKAHAGLKE